MSRGVSFLAALAAALLTAKAARAGYCPCFTASSTHNERGCAIEAVAGANPTIDAWNEIFDLVARGPAAWGDAGPPVADIGQGCGGSEPPQDVPARFPCELLKAIAMQESAWQHFCVPSTPADQAGLASRTIISRDCGYGVGQVTSGMREGETADFDRARVAADPIYNLATGTRILAAKWKVTKCVGDRQPAVIEHWYSAAWAYNGLSYVNNPNNPNYEPGRGVWNPAIGGAAPYQERVFGRLELTDGRWTEVLVAYPNPGEIGGGSAPNELPDPSCASPTDCVSTRPLHTTQCGDESGDGGGGSGAGEDGGSGGASTPDGGTGGAGGSGGGSDVAFTFGGEVRGTCSCRAPGSSPVAGWAWLALPFGTLAAVCSARLPRRRRH
jgi:hypothetical protein